MYVKEGYITKILIFNFQSIRRVTNIKEVVKFAEISKEKRAVIVKLSKLNYCKSSNCKKVSQSTVARAINGLQKLVPMQAVNVLVGLESLQK